jgi:tetratricopeptide (TPR) repeat protein
VGDFSGARRALQQALAEDPQSLACRLALIDLLVYDLADYRAAIALCRPLEERGIESAPMAMAMFLAHQQLGRTAEAFAAVKRAAELAPDWHDPWARLSALLVQAGRWSDAAFAQRRANQLKPDDPGGLYTLASCLFNLGRLAEAAECEARAASLERARMGAPGDATAPFARA